ncbi:MAG: hypothetical protein AAFR38_05780 [Planctomycetota bacterium]
MTRSMLSTAAVSLACACGPALAQLGPLNPPAGPVADTPELEPRTVLSAVNTPGDADSVFKITQPGSYVLTADVVVPAGQVGVDIAANEVSIDLNGFTIRGDGTAEAGISPAIGDTPGIVSFYGLRVSNGRISGCRTGLERQREVEIGNNEEDLQIFETSITQVVATDLEVDGASIGIRILRGRVERCGVRASSSGINVRESRVVDCRVELSGQTFRFFGILSTDSLVSGCAVNADAGQQGGVIGISALRGQVENCWVQAPLQFSTGIEISNCAVQGCSVTSGAVGFRADGAAGMITGSFYGGTGMAGAGLGSVIQFNNSF